MKKHCADGIVEYMSGNIFIRKMKLKKIGDKIETHTHKFAHTTFVMKGSVHVRITKDDKVVKEKDFKPRDFFLVEAEDGHEMTATKNNTEVWCVYSHRNAQGEVVQENTGWKEVVTESWREQYM